MNFCRIRKIQNVRQNETQYSKTLAMGTDSHLDWEARQFRTVFTYEHAGLVQFLGKGDHPHRYDLGLKLVNS